MYIYVCMCVCVCVYFETKQKKAAVTNERTFTR